MQFLLDHIASILVSGAVLLLVISTSLNAQRASIEETVAYAAKVQTLSMADFLEDDLLLIGDGTDETIQEIDENSDDQTILFSFWRQDESGTDMLVSYTLTEQDSVKIGDDWVQLYQLNRFENGVAAGGDLRRSPSFVSKCLTLQGMLRAEFHGRTGHLRKHDPRR